MTIIGFFVLTMLEKGLEKRHKWKCYHHQHHCVQKCGPQEWVPIKSREGEQGSPILSLFLETKWKDLYERYHTNGWRMVWGRRTHQEGTKSCFFSIFHTSFWQFSQLFSNSCCHLVQISNPEDKTETDSFPKNLKFLTLRFFILQV